MFRTIHLSVLMISWLCLASSAYPQELVTNPGFEGTFSTRAPNWGNISWGTGTSVTYEPSTVNVHGGDTCQKMTVNQFGPGGGVLLYQNIAVDTSNVYQASVWLRADAPIDVAVSMRTNNSAYHYRTCGIHIVTLDINWQEIRFDVVPAYDNDQANHQLIIALKQTGIGVYIDDASLINVTDTRLDKIKNGLATQLPIPETYFGLHINKGHEGIWPPIGQKFIRLWDTGTRWCDIEPADDSYYWTRFDIYVNSLIQNNDPNCKILYTLGITPSWANSQADGTKPPDDMTDWEDYVRHVVQRYKGKIHYYEIWNEVNVNTFYTGSVTELVELAQRAHAIIRQEDPTAVVMTPNFAFFGLSIMAAYFNAGGGTYADAVSYHAYHPMEDNGTRNRMLTLLAPRSIADQYGFENLPLYNTETALTHGQTASPTDTQIRAGMAHGMILNRIYGSETYPHYFWEPSSALRVALAVYIDDDELTVGGQTYKQLVGWLKGQRFIAFENLTAKTSDPVTVYMQRGTGQKAIIAWAWNGNPTYTPDPAMQIDTIMHLDGSTQSYTGGAITLDHEPVLLKSNPSTCENLVGYWTADQTPDDLTAFKHDLTISGPVSYNDGIHGKAFSFTGTTGEHLTADSTQMLQTSKLTISLWYKIATNASWDRYLLGKSNFGTKSGFQLYLDSQNLPVFRLYDGSNWGWVTAQITSPSAPILDQWHHVVATYDGTVMQLFVDGTLQATKTLSNYSINHSNDALKIGGSYNGLIDEARLYNFAMTQNEVDALYGLTGHWTLDSTTITSSLTDPVLNGSTTGSPAVEAGRIDDCLVFDNAQGTSVTINNQPELSSDQFTYSLWINCQEVWASSTSTYKYLISKSSWNDREGFLLMGKNSGQLIFRTYDGSDWGWQSRQIAIPFTQYVGWTHIVAVNDATELRLYINGTCVAQKNVSNNYVDHSGGNLKIGQYFTGMIDDMRYYDRPLSERQIQLLYYNQTPEN